MLIALSPLLPPSLWTFGSDHDNARLLQLLVIPLAVLSLMTSRKRLVSPKFSKFAASGICGLLLLGSLAVWFADRPDIALREWILTLSLAACIAALIPTGDDAAPQTLERWFLPGLIAGASLYAGLELLLLILGLVFDRVLDYWHVFAGYDNPRFFNHVQTVLIPLLVGLTKRPTLSTFWRRLTWFALIMNAFFLLLVLGRATIVGLIVGMLTAVIAFGAQGRDFARRLLMAFAGGALVYLIVIKGLPALLSMQEVPAFRDLGERGSVEARFYLWNIALRDIAAHPWFGVGPMHYAHQANGEAAHPHNIYLQVAAEFGLPFFVLLAVLVGRWLWRCGRQLRDRQQQTPDPLALGCYLAIVAALVDGAFSGNFVMPLPQVWIVLAIALLNWRMHGTSPASPTHADGRWRFAPVMWGVLLIGQVYLVATALPEFLNAPARIEGAPPSSPADTAFHPRFWLDGWF